MRTAGLTTTPIPTFPLKGKESWLWLTTTAIPTFLLKGKESLLRLTTIPIPQPCRVVRALSMEKAISENLPSPSGGGLGWGWFQFRERNPNRFLYRTDIGQYVVVPEPQYFKTFRLQECGTRFVVSRSCNVLTTVQLDA
jgi:hypothetical protein